MCYRRAPRVLKHAECRSSVSRSCALLHTPTRPSTNLHWRAHAHCTLQERRRTSKIFLQTMLKFTLAIRISGLGITSHYSPYTEWAQCAINSQQALGNPRDSLHRIRNVPFGSGSTPTTNTRAEKHTDADTLFNNNNIRCRTESALLPAPIAHKNRRGTFRENNTAKIAAEPLFSHRFFVGLSLR
jgi:hypothetical protein